jgi:hypothetical protein
VVVGIEDLLLIHDTPADKSEILWVETELGAAQLERLVRSKDEMRAFREHEKSETGWYVAQVVLAEVHDTGAHENDRTLVWINYYLISAEDTERAYVKALELGKSEQEAGQHRCDGDPAHWDFRGLEDLAPLDQSPSDGALLWCDPLRSSAVNSQRPLPKRDELSVFRWEAQHRH